MTAPTDPRLVRVLKYAEEYAEGDEAALAGLQDVVANLDAEFAAPSSPYQKVEAAVRLLMRAGSREFDDRPAKNAPGHRHKAAPYWDLDGRRCDWCHAWNELYLALRALDR